jgi:DNA invertase Pin-like site-specific DNA recombinase
MATIGYARVSTKDQSLDIQIEQLEAAGCTKIFREKVSGSQVDNRPKLRRMISVVEAGDVVIVARLDRLARSTRDLLCIIDDLTAKGAKLRSIAEPWLDTTSDLGQLVMTILGGLAQFERSLIMARTQAGIAKAKENGVQFGRKRRLNAKQKQIIGERYRKGETITELAADFGVGVGTIHRALHEGEAAADAMPLLGIDVNAV